MVAAHLFKVASALANGDRYWLLAREKANEQD
jgi:hypothetical protein